MSSESAFNRLAVMRSFEGGMEEVSIITVVFGGKATIFSMSCVAARCNLWREMEDKTLEVSSEV